MTKYCYSQLSSPTNIRLLRLLPSKSDEESLQGELFEYRLRNSDKDKPSHPYEALSYVWNDDKKPQFIVIGNLHLDITQNLYTALLHLRDHDCARILWVDAICINQEKNEEKQVQIPLMAEIYAKALRVVVWLGNADNCSDQALEVIRLAGERSAGLSIAEAAPKSTPESVLQLLKRPWFRRIWVLQEMAAAQHVQIMCGSTKIDGYAFCLGIEFLGAASEDVRAQVTFLIRGAIFRSGKISRRYGKPSLDICSLGELLDMYHAHGATKLHDKVYALLGMCSDDLGKPEAAGLEPNYDLEWKELMRNVIQFILGSQVFVDTWEDKELAMIKSRGFILGKVSDVANTELGGQRLAVIHRSKQLGLITDDSWNLRKSAIPIQKGDFICVLQGTSKPTIIRLCDDHFIIIMIAAVHSEYTQAQSLSPTREFALQLGIAKNRVSEPVKACV
ncbi:HET-domain-containing protein [Lepidopterella palustris CBS 459.81]|uniref:HET-domain-containing protein n=1 Tax=Lepidopterella palustris CBS 459.81 TaxID=1314670 RepID=A0A8E2DWY8_9PEZI|nr:HET-domain-containing protein [Lepidopterella palustris CBS 459.81]